MKNGGSNSCLSIPQGCCEENNLISYKNILLAIKNKTSINVILRDMRSLITSVQNEPKDKRALRKLMSALAFGVVSRLI